MTATGSEYLDAGPRDRQRSDPGSIRCRKCVSERGGGRPLRALACPEERRAWPVHDVDHDAAWCVAEAEDGIGAPVVVGSASGRSPPVECNRLGCSERRAYHGFVPIGTDARNFGQVRDEVWPASRFLMEGLYMPCDFNVAADQIHRESISLVEDHRTDIRQRYLCKNSWCYRHPYLMP